MNCFHLSKMMNKGLGREAKDFTQLVEYWSGGVLLLSNNEKQIFLFLRITQEKYINL